VLFALGPAWSLSRTDLANDLKLAPGLLRRRVGGGSVLLVGQLAVSLALVAAGGLFARAAVNATGADAGYPLERQIVVGLDPSLAGYNQPKTRATYAAMHTAGPKRDFDWRVLPARLTLLSMRRTDHRRSRDRGILLQAPGSDSSRQGWWSTACAVEHWLSH